MIIVRIWEGLGNQFFQYAYARSLQQRIQIPVFLDVRHNNRGDLPFEKEDIVKRKLGIQHFRIGMKGIQTHMIPSLHCLDETGILGGIRYLSLNGIKSKWRVISDEGAMCGINSDIMHPENNTYISAHCVNKLYYGDCRDILLQEMQLRSKLKLSASLEEIIKNRDTVSIHIRLTDYLRDPSVICQQEYYDRAIQYIKKRVNNPYFIVFTDDCKSAQKRFQFEGNVYWISRDKYADYEELVLMSKCRHNIIARSTFSYWGAWLNQNPEKIVVAPRQLFGGSLYEKGWKII